MLTTLALLSVVIFLLYKYFEKKYRYWDERGIACLPVVWPLGSLFYLIQKSSIEYGIENLKKYGRIYGGYQGTRPILTISDYELAKKIIIKDFLHFNTRVDFRTYHKLWNENLVFSGFERWKRIRTIASPAFTAAKLKAMNPLMQNCIDKLIAYLDMVCNHDANNNDEQSEKILNEGVIQTKEVLGGFTMDVIASAAFGTETNANGLRESSNPIITHGQRLFMIQFRKFLLAFTLPKSVLRWLGVEHFLDTESFNFFINLTQHIVRERRDKKVFRTDFVQFLLDAEVDEVELEKTNFDHLTAPDSNEKEKFSSTASSSSRNLRLTEDELIAQCIIFLTAGFETTASTITHAIHELSLNDTIQNKLYDEVIEVVSELDVNSNEYYEAIMYKTPYLEAVIKETLRKCPPLSRLNRICNTDGYQLTETLKLEKGQTIEIMTIAMHRDPEYFPNPDEFIPDRFLSGNSKDMPFLPWGGGPRNCIGMRFSLQEMKFCLARLVQRYRFEKPNSLDAHELKYRKATPFLNCYDFPTKVSLR